MKIKVLLKTIMKILIVKKIENGGTIVTNSINNIDNYNSKNKTRNNDENN